MDETAAKTPESPPKREGPPESLFLHHLARSPENRVARRLRPGNRQGFLLEDGTRVRRKGGRVTEVSMEDAFQNVDKIIQGVEEKYITVSLDGDGQAIVPISDLEGMKDPDAIKRYLQAKKAYRERVMREMEERKAKAKAEERRDRVEKAKAFAAELAAKAEAAEKAIAATIKAAEQEAEAERKALALAEMEEDERLEALAKEREDAEKAKAAAARKDREARVAAARQLADDLAKQAKQAADNVQALLDSFKDEDKGDERVKAAAAEAKEKAQRAAEEEACKKAEEVAKADETAKAQAAADAEKKELEESAEKESVLTAEELMKHTRGELEELAKEAGAEDPTDKEAFPNKQTLVTLILGKKEG